jgi:hypothetical protein
MNAAPAEESDVMKLSEGSDLQHTGGLVIATTQYLLAGSVA